MQLFCFTFAGGSGSFFNGLEAYVQPVIQVEKMEYAGHIERRHEPFYKDFDALVLDMYTQIVAKNKDDEPYALFGYSMGALVAAEVLNMIQDKREIPAPVHVFLASHGPCPILERTGNDTAETDEAVKHWTIRFGGLPDKLINSRTFWRVYLPIYRADYKLLMEYDYGRLTGETDVPATVLFSPADITRSIIEGWRNAFTVACDVLEYDGGHFFLRKHEREVADVIKERLIKHDI